MRITRIKSASTSAASPYFYIFAAMGLVCAVLAFFLFRRREMERSGDVVAIRALRPVFLCLFSLGCALVIGYLLAMFVSNADYNFPLMLALQLAGAFLGYFRRADDAAKDRPRLRQQARMDRLRRALYRVGWYILRRALRLLRLQSKVPDPRSVSSVSLRGTRVTEKDDIEAVVALHQEIVDQQETQLAPAPE